MNKQTAEALEKSIKKWEDILNNEDVDLGTKNCALCELFHHYNCNHCPVKNKSGMTFCNDTPYEKWEIHHEEMHGDPSFTKRQPNCPICEKLAKDEIDFLKSLRSK
jgi:hypothetical protein